MINKLKVFALQAIRLVSALHLRLRGVQLGSNCNILGRVRILRKKGSQIILHDNVSIISSNRFNPIVRQGMTMITFSSHAVIEIAKGAGMSGSHIACCERITVGEKTIIGPDTLIFDWKAHNYSPTNGWLGRTRIQGAPIHIGANCYIGTRCTILKGVTIGDNSIVAAGTIVNKDIPAGHLASGNPMTITALPERLGGPTEAS